MLNHKGTKVIETERLILRKIRLEDANDMYNNWASDEEVCRYLSWKPHPNIEITNRIITKWVLDSYDIKNYHWAIEYKKQVIGTISVVDYSEVNESCEIGYCIGKDYWGKGIMTEALIAVINFLFLEVGYNRIMLKHDINNIASGKVMQKAGMKYEGTLRQATKKMDERFVDICMYSILHEEWIK